MKIPSQLDRYEIRSLLGVGGMGEVYRAHDPKIGREVAIKILPSSAAANPDRLRRFEWEARTAGMLSHPNLLVVHDVGVYEQSPYIVSELLEGETLRTRLSAGRLTSRGALDYAIQIARGLAALHDKGILHRDLKPENVFITRDGRVKILDFGLAKLQAAPGEELEAAASNLRTEPGRVMGTAAYMSPEQVRCEPVDERSDLFSFGSVLYEMLAGRPAFRNASAVETMHEILKSDPPDLTDVDPKIPPALSRLVRHCLEKHPEARFQSARDLAFALEAIPLFESSGRELDMPPAVRQVLDSQSATLQRARSTVSTAIPTNLPAVTTRLVGRTSELGSLRSLLRAESPRLVTLTGPGGAGKTRLAIEAARAVADEFNDGVFFVSLASIGDPALLAVTVAQTVGAPELAGRSAIEALCEHLRDKKLLLLIDNFEQLLAAAPQLSDLLGAAPAVKILATSQSPLHLHGEHEFPVAPLPLPQSDRVHEIRATSAVALFVERATAVNLKFELTERNAGVVAEICRHLDGLPLAIELAAARVKVLSPEAILEKLEKPLAVLTGGPRDLPERQRTMRKAIEWSHAPLSAEEKTLFRRLAIFRGGCTLEAVEEICWWDAPAEFLETFSALVDRSLLKRDEEHDGTSRFSMLEMIRSFAAELLGLSGPEEELLNRRHAAHYAALAERAEPELTGPAQAQWLRALAREHHNFREAIEWSLRSGSIDGGLRLAAALRPYWILRGHLSEARDQIERLIARAHQVQSTNLVKALYTAGILADAQGDYSAARRHFERNLEIHRSRDDLWGVANSLNNLGIVALRERDFARAGALYQESLDFWRRIGNRSAAALSLQNLGNVAQLQARHEDARRLYEESLAEFRALGDERGVARSLNLLADVARSEGQLEKARQLYEQSLEIFMKLTDHWDVANALADLGHVARSTGDRAEAHSLYEESLLIFRELGDMIGAARLLNAHVLLAGDQRQADRALVLAAAAAALRKTAGAALPLDRHSEVECLLDQMRAILGETRSQQAWQTGTAMSLDDAVALVERLET